jgi:tetratricopeptide (TPR) repeat protein
MPDFLAELASQARDLGQQSRTAEDQGNLDAALTLNEAASVRFQKAGDAPGLLVAYRSRALILLRLGRLDDACAQLARSLALALQMDAEFVWDTVGQIVGVAGYLAQAQPAQMLALGAALRSALEHVQAVRGDFPLDLRGPVELTTALSHIYAAMGMLDDAVQGREPLPEPAVERLRNDAVTQAWAVDALSRQAWGLVPWLKVWLEARGLPGDL